MAEVLACLGLLSFQESPSDVMLGVARADRKVNQMLYRHGAECLAPNLNLHGVPVDLVAYWRGRELTFDSHREEDRLIQLR